MSDAISLTITHWNGDSFTVEAEATEYVDDLKERIFELKKINVENQRLTMNGEEVDETETLADQGIVNGSGLCLEAMKIMVVLPNKKKLRISLTKEDKVKRIKKIVAKKAKIAFELQCVMFDGNECMDGQTVAECNIDHGDVVGIETYCLQIQGLDGDVFDVKDANPNNTIEDIMTYVEEKKGIPRAEQEFSYEGRVVNAFVSLKGQQIKHRALLEMEEKEPAGGAPKKEKFKLSLFPTDDPAAPNGANAGPSKVTLTIKHWDGKTFSVECDSDEYMDDVKEKIQKKSQVPVDSQRLTFNGEPVEDADTLKEQKIGDGATLTLESMKLSVAFPDKKGKLKQLRMAANPDDKIKRIKKMLAKKSGIAVDSQVMMFNGQEIKDSATLSDENIQHGMMLEVKIWEISIEHWDGETFVLSDITPTDTVDDVKTFLLENHDIPKEQQTVTFETLKLNTFLSLKDLQVKHKTVLTLEEPEEKPEKKEKFKLELFPTGAAPGEGPKMPGTSGETINLTIQHWDGKTTFSVEFGSTEYIEDLKERINDVQKIPLEQQRLSCNGELLEDDQTLEEQNITDGSTLVLEPMQLLVLLPTGKKLKFSIKPEDSIKKIKKAIYKKGKKYQVDEQCLLFGGVELSELKTAGECNLSHEDTLHLEIFEISIAHWSGDIFVLKDIRPGDTLEDIRNMIFKQKQIPKEEQNYTCNGNKLNEFLSFKDQGVKHKSVLVMEEFSNVIFSPIKKNRPSMSVRPSTIENIPGLDMFDESDDDDDDASASSAASWLKEAAHDEDYTKELSKIDTSNPESSWLAQVAKKQEDAN